MRAITRTTTPERTLAFGNSIGAVLRPGDVIGLIGTLGAGKTLLTRGVVAGVLAAAGLPEEAVRVSSPSYTMVNTYVTNTLTVHHLDLYRVASADDLESVGYWEYVEDPNAIALVEWMDQVPEALPARYATLTLEVEDPDDPHGSARRVTLGEVTDTDLASRLTACIEAHNA